MMRTMLASMLACAAVCAQAQLFSEEERASVMQYWGAPGRYRVGAPPDSVRTGPFQVRLTVAGSQWLWNYNRARGLGKTPPGSVPPPQSERETVWEAWIEAKVAHDRWLAGVGADRANADLGKKSQLAGATPPAPGPIPADLFDLAGNPPPFASVEAPLYHVTTFDDVEIALADNVPMRPRYAYYRFEDGVMSGGQRVRDLPEDELKALCADAGLSESEFRIFRAVSLLEGGFDSINTYDTGFVSVGLIQFASLSEGGGSLGSVMVNLKFADPDAFHRDFRRFGLDVTLDGKLVAMDPSTGAVSTGAEANKTIIRDKRLIAVFQRAGRVCRPFRVAQLRVAKTQYYPADDLVPIVAGNQVWQARIADIVKSEAGLATLMDRKVNTGKVDPLATVLSTLVASKQIRSVAELANYEAEIVGALKYRKDYTADPLLSKPSGARQR